MASLTVLQESPKDIAALATRGPRYTSYPPAPHFTSDFGEEQAVLDLNLHKEQSKQAGISLYTHIPFCSQLCWYCGCNVKITSDRSRGADYVQTLLKELKLYAKQLDGHHLSELSMGGGSPNFLDNETMKVLMEGINQSFKIRPESLLGIELDPRDTTLDQVTALADLGFRRLSVGVQDFEKTVQETINRLQSREQTEEMITHARTVGFSSVGIDLVYGLPGQTIETSTQTLNAILEIAPERIALFGYAHLPHIIKHQRLVERKPIPDLNARAHLLLNAIKLFTEAGYVRVGFDHFALPDDPLAKAALGKTLHRNFQGFTLPHEGPLLAVGMTGITDTGTSYWQNHSDLEAWKKSIDAGHLPIKKGLKLNTDDTIRRHVIYRLMCDSRVDMKATGEQFKIDFSDYFAWELEELSKPSHAQFATIDRENASIEVTALGFELIRNLCMIFDKNLRDKEPKGSTTI